MTTLVFVAGAARRQSPHRQAAAQARRRRRLRHADTIRARPPMWITKRLEKDELTIEPKALTLLLQTTGLSLGRIRAEIEKLVLYAAGESDHHARARARSGDSRERFRRGVRADRCGAEFERATRVAGNLGADRRGRAAADDSRPVARGRDPVAAGCARARTGSKRCCGPTWRSSRRRAHRSICWNAWPWSSVPDNQPI